MMRTKLKGLSAAQCLTNLVKNERDRFENRDNNIFAFAYSQVIRYCSFVSEIVARYRGCGRSYIRATRRYINYLNCRGAESGPMTKADMDRWNDVERLTALVQLEIECYFVFSKILLDRLAQAIEIYFGRVRGVSIHTHHLLAENLEPYARNRKLRAYRALWRHARSLQVKISAFRDKFIVHESSPRTVKSLSFTRGRVNMAVSRIYPKDSDVTEWSGDLVALDKAIREFIFLVARLIERNPDRTNLKLLS